MRSPSVNIPASKSAARRLPWTLWAALALGLLWLALPPAAARADADDSELQDLQQAVSRAVDRVAPTVVRVISPELTKEQRQAMAKEEHERRLREQEARAADKDVESEKPQTDEADEDELLPPSDETPDSGSDESEESEEEPPPEAPVPQKAPAKEPAGKTDQPAATAEAPVKPTETAGKILTRTGLLVSADGCVVTSRANIGLERDRLKIELPDGRVLPAKRLGEDLRRDVVLLKIEAEKLPVPEAAPKSDLRVGQWVLALGRTLPVEKPTVNKGIISALGRMAGVAIQTDADVSPMNFGGPLVDLRGRVVAMVAAVSVPMGGGAGVSAERFSDSGIGFAIPLEDILAELPQLRGGQTIESPFLGIRFDMGRLGHGALIIDVLAGTGASDSGLAKGDLITEFQGRTIETPFQLLYEIGSRNVGDKVSFKVLRGDKTLTLTAVLTARPERYR